jgi:cytochrome c-type biogenesis protein CcmE
LKPRHKRIALIIGGLAILALVATLVLNAFQSNLVFFFSPTQVAAGEAPRARASASAAWSRKARCSASPTA